MPMKAKPVPSSNRDWVTLRAIANPQEVALVSYFAT